MVTADERLRRAYQRLIRAYPRWYRRERGAEMLATLLDDATPGQRRPARVDVIDVLRGAVRARLRPPRGFGARLVMTVVALYAALSGAAGALLLSGYPGPPTDAQAVAAATQAVPLLPRNVPGPAVQCDIICPFWDGQDDVVAFHAPPDRTDRTVVYFPIPWADAPMAAAQARDRLVAAGWDASPLRIQSDGHRSFEASRDGLRLSLTASPNTPDAAIVSSPVSVTVSKGFSVTAVVDLVAGFVGGLLAGWMTAVWALQRYRRQASPRRWRMVVGAAPFLAIALLTVWTAAGLAVTTAMRQDLSPKILKVPLVVIPGFWWPVTVVAGISAIVALGLAALPGRVGDPPLPTRGTIEA